jgi:hypothetical protein
MPNPRRLTSSTVNALIFSGIWLDMFVFVSETDVPVDLSRLCDGNGDDIELHGL